MRQVVLDTETTGLEVTRGDRVIEIGCVELAGRRLTGRRFHRYLNPEREVEAGALAVHGIDDDFLRDKPKFADIAEEFIEFVGGAELVIHNAPFDLGFLDHELDLAGRPPLAGLAKGVIDTLKLARELHPGRKNSLSALCERYSIDHSHRSLHGALLDAELLADVYLAMTRGQESLIMEFGTAACEDRLPPPAERAPLAVLRADEDEVRSHERLLAEIERESKGQCLWLRPEV
ncbi:MAG: DNA polymerase III subunit epsilon [Rhodocyclaceae bacterium]